MWKLTNEQKGKRIYTNSVTGTQCTTTMVHTDNEGNNWWGFDNIMLLPYTRQFAASTISALYQLGLSKEDLTGHISKLKTLLKANDPEKYEKAYAEVLDFENKAINATDSLKKMSSLVCVYYLLNDEKVDVFDKVLQIEKMSILENDPEAHSFFLRSLIEVTSNYTTHLTALSRTVSPSINVA